MKGVLLCGDIISDSRLKPIIYSVSRSMIPIANVPFIEYLIKQMVECGIDNIAIVVGEGKQDFELYFKNGKDFGCRIRYYRQHKNTGLAGQLLCIKHFVDDDNFFVAQGNVFIDFKMDQYLKQFKKEKCDGLLLTKQLEKPWKHDIAIFEKGKLIEIIKKPKITNSKTALTGIYIFTPAILRAASKIRPSKRGEYEITDAIQYLIDREYKISTMDMDDGTWIDASRDSDLLECNKYVLSKIDGKSKIDEDSKIENSIIGDYTSVGKRCSIKNAVISNCIIMNDCIIDGVEMKDCIIGEYSTIIGNGCISGIMGPKTKIYLTPSLTDEKEKDEYI